MPWMLLTDRWFGKGLTTTPAGRARQDQAGSEHGQQREQQHHLQSSVTRLVFRLNPHERHSDRFRTVSPATSWAMHTAGPTLIEPWQALMPDGGTLAATASWRQLWAFREIGKATLWADVRWAMGSFAVTAALVWMNTGSLFLTVGGMSVVVTSLAAAQFIQVFAVGVRWVGLLNFLGIFIILGIGADDLFIILDFWRQSAEEHQNSPRTAVARVDGPARGGRRGRGDAVLVSRMHWTIQKSQYVVTMTSLTTAVAFACNLASNIAPIRLFGVFMTTLVVCNYWLVCTTFPALIIMHHRSTRRAARVGRAFRRLRRGWCVSPEAADASTSSATGSAAKADRLQVVVVANDRRTPTVTPSTPSSSGARHLLTLRSRRRSHHRRSWSCAPPLAAASSCTLNAAADDGDASATSADLFFLRVPLLSSSLPPLPPSPPSPPLPPSSPPPSSPPPSSSPPSSSTPQLITSPPPLIKLSPMLSPPHHRRSFSLNLDDEFRRRHRSCRAKISFEMQEGQTRAGSKVMMNRDSVAPRSVLPRALETIAIPTAEDEEQRGGGGGSGGGDEISCASYVSIAPTTITNQTCTAAEALACSAAYDSDIDEALVGASSGGQNDHKRKIGNYKMWGDTAIRTLADFVVRFRWPIVFAAAGFLAGSIVVARRFESPPHAGITMYPDGHNINRFEATSSLFAFAQIEQAVRVRFVWGLSESTASSSSSSDVAWDPQKPLEFSSSKPGGSRKDNLKSLFEDPSDNPVATAGGKTSEVPSWDPSFDVSSVESQAWMLAFCAALRESAETAGRLKDSRSVDCFMEEVDARVRNLSGGEVGLPLPSAQFAAALGAYGQSDDNDGGTVRWLDIKPHAEDGTSGSGSDSSSSSSSSSSSPQRGAVAAVSVVAVLRASSSASSADQLASEETFWEEWFTHQLTTAPPGLRGGFQSSPVWVLVATEEEIVQGAWTALGLSIVFAFLVLLGASKSLRLAALATLSIGSVAASFIAFAVLSGWHMGIIEAVCTMILVGLSLDYILHVAGAYVRTPPGRRADRAKGALRAVGSSVVSGASTTVGANLFLLGCTITFFTKFGCFIALTLSMSLVQAVVVFPAVCAVFGPEGRGRHRCGGGPGDAQQGQALPTTTRGGTTTARTSSSDALQQCIETRAEDRRAAGTWGVAGRGGAGGGVVGESAGGAG